MVQRFTCIAVRPAGSFASVSGYRCIDKKDKSTLPIQKLTILESPYIFAIATCGLPYWGRPFVDAEKILKEKHRLWRNNKGQKKVPA